MVSRILGRLVIVALFATSGPTVHAAAVWLEAESFKDTGGWSRDPQHMDIMGSPYLLATGLGKPVADAVTSVKVEQAGAYRLWVRCRDWFPSHAPGRFRVSVNGKASKVVFGKAEKGDWRWVDGGVCELVAGDVEVRLQDTTGWWARCDAVVLATGDFRPADDLKELARQRVQCCGVTPDIKDAGVFDLVVVGGGPAGCGAAVAAARHGCKVAFIQDRPVLGGNASSEIEIPPMGYIGKPPDKVNVTGLAKEFFPKQGWSSFADSKRIETIVRAEKNISLFLLTRATGVEMAAEDRIKSVRALDLRTGQRLRFSAPLFVDCTGHGWVGYYAGAEYRMGQEARSEFNESLAPEKPGKRTMGNSLYKAVFKTHRPSVEADGVPFECPPWAYQWTKSSDFEPRGSHRRIREPRRPENFDVPSRGKGRNPGDDVNGAISHAWWVEYGGTLDTIQDAEEIRDELFRISLGLWNYAKNHNPKTKEKNKWRELVWLNYVPGVRESRRLVGDHIMTQAAYDQQIVHPDTVAFTDWGPDVHHPEGFWVRGNDCIHVYQGRRASIPYRTLYSKNIVNLFMAGRCHSTTHIALGGTRVIRPMCATGQAAGTAAAIAHEHGVTPRDIYARYIKQLQQMLLKDGCYLMGVKNEDENDLALCAKASASSSVAGLPAEKAINGWNRVVGKDRNAWSPDATAEGPHRLQLDLAKSTGVSVAHLTFETKDVACRIEAWTEGEWKKVADVNPTGARRRVVSFKAVETGKIRFILKEPVPICEVRLYGSGP